jgi:hypothetical protein
MEDRSSRIVFTALVLAFAMLLAAPATCLCQTFRGGISGTVTDQSGAVVQSGGIY